MERQASLTPTGYALVTGAASGIGQAISERLTAEGWAVAWVDQQDITSPASAGQGARFVCDVAEIDDWRDLEARLRDRWPRIDLLVNCAGVLIGGDLVDSPEHALARVLDVNLKGVLLGCRVLAPWLIESRSQRPCGVRPLPGVVNVSSVFAALAPPGFAAYSASKAGLIAFSESLRGELAPHGLNVTVAAPGVVRTPLFARSWFASLAYTAAAERFLANSQLEPSHVATEIARAASRGKPVAVIGARARRLWLLKRLLPGLAAKMVARRAKSVLGETTFPNVKAGRASENCPPLASLQESEGGP